MSASIARLAARRVASTPARNFTTVRPAQNVASVASSMPIGDAVRNVAERAASGVAHHQAAAVEGFKAGVVYTILAGSVATAGILTLAPAGERTVESKDLL